MLKKGDYNSNLFNITKKTKQYTEPNESYTDFNKENMCSKSMLEPLNDSHGTEHMGKLKGHDLSGNGSTLISPTFQSIPQLSLKDHQYKQDNSYINVNFSLKDMNKKSNDHQSANHFKGADNAQNGNQQKYQNAMKEVQQLKRQLLDHYKSKKYWNKISALFDHDQVDAVFAWQEAIEKYKSVKTSNEQLLKENQKLENAVAVKEEKINSLEKQIMQDKNETKVLSHKKCKGCENLQQKQKEYQELYGQHKKIVKQLEQLKLNMAQLNEQNKNLDEKYKSLVFIKEEVQKKNTKLSEKEKQLTIQIQKLQKILKQDSSSSKDLHIEIQKLKEDKYQIEKNITKNEEKHRREVVDLKLELNGLQQQKNILLTQSEKTKIELNETKSKLFKMQFQLESIDQTLKIKTIQCQDLKKRHIGNMSEELKRKNGLDDLLKNKQEELKKAYHLIDQVENAKVNIEMELNQERKASMNKDEELGKHLDVIKELEDRNREFEDKMREYEDKLREFEQNEHRIKEVNQNFSLNRNKNINMTNFQGNSQSTSPQNSSLLIRISSKIKQLYTSFTQINQQNSDSYQKRKNRDDLSQEREQINLLKTQRYINEIYTEFSNFRNKYQFICKQNETLKMQIDNQMTYKHQEIEQLQRQIDLKQEALRAIILWIPEELKEIVVQFLCMTQQLSKDENHEQLQFQEYEELKQSLEAQGKQWKDSYQKQDRRFKKMEDEMRRLEEQNEQLKRKMKINDPKRQLQTEYDYKKDIRKKYNI